MIDESKVDELFATFIRSGNGNDDIKQLYDVLPYLNNDQMRVLTLYNALGEKYNSNVIREISRSIINYTSSNRKLGWTFKRLVESMSLYKHFKGFKASTNMGNDEQ